jgi:hypothetical protein
MTRDSGFIDFLEDYLDEHEGHTPLPDEARDAIRAQLPSTHQRPAWWPGWRFPEMNNTVRIALAGAAVVVVAFLGIQLLAPQGGSGIGNPGEASPTPQPTPSPSAEAVAPIVIGEGFLSAARVTTPRPAGWHLDANFANKGGETPDGIGFSAWTTTGVYADPCHWGDENLDLRGKPTAAAILAGLVVQEGRNASTPVETTLGGWPAMRVELTTPADVNIANCDLGRYKAWTDLSDPSGGNWNHQNGQVDVVYVVDVDRGPVVVTAWHQETTSVTDLAELQDVLDAMVIDLR